jgi:hypothetical protein
MNNEGKQYFDEIPEVIPDGMVLVHSHVIPSPVIGSRGFQAWLAPESVIGAPPPPEFVSMGSGTLEPCNCWWAPQHKIHYSAAPGSWSGWPSRR